MRTKKFEALAGLSAVEVVGDHQQVKIRIEQGMLQTAFHRQVGLSACWPGPCTKAHMFYVGSGPRPRRA